MKIYTKSGDKGKTALIAGPRVYKDAPRVVVNGTLDEANSSIGLLRVKLGKDHEWQPKLYKIQKDLMDMGGHLAIPSKNKTEIRLPKPTDGAEFCEQWIDEMEEAISSPSEYFLLPGGNEISALCHICRTQIRRAEQQLVTVLRDEGMDAIEDYILQYVNRMSDLFFTMARYEMDKHGVIEEKWELFIYKA